MFSSNTNPLTDILPCAAKEGPGAKKHDLAPAARSTNKSSQVRRAGWVTRVIHQISRGEVGLEDLGSVLIEIPPRPTAAAAAANRRLQPQRRPPAKARASTRPRSRPRPPPRQRRSPRLPLAWKLRLPRRLLLLLASRTSGARPVPSRTMGCCMRLWRRRRLQLRPTACAARRRWTTSGTTTTTRRRWPATPRSWLSSRCAPAPAPFLWAACPLTRTRLPRWSTLSGPRAVPPLPLPLPPLLPPLLLLPLLRLRARLARWPPPCRLRASGATSFRCG